MDDRQRRLATAKNMVAMLERLSADSYWAHRASGLRGSLIRFIERIEGQSYPLDLNGTDERALTMLLDHGYEILGKAAGEIRTPDLK